jgi:ATP-dependent DNA helicase DinG
MLSPADILGPGGRIARRLKQYELRPQQLEMAEAVARAIAERKHLLVEAGTGVGKSFAYLVPAILATAEEPKKAKDKSQKVQPGAKHTPAHGPSGEPNGTAAGQAPEEKRPRRVIVTTHTISLQEQLITKDLPFLRAVIPLEFSAVLVKGRRNYLSRRRLAAAVERARNLFHLPDELEQLDQIASWIKKSLDGTLSDLPFRPLPQVWDEVQSDHGNCMAKQCPTYTTCYYYKARRRIYNAQVLVVNHALFFSDLALRRAGVSLLPQYDIVIFDEAHTLEAVAGNHMGVSITSGQVEYALNKLYNRRTNRGLLVHHRLHDLQREVDHCRTLAGDFFDDVLAWHEAEGRKNGRVHRKEIVPGDTSEALENLSERLRDSGKKMEKEEDEQDFLAAANRLDGLADLIEVWRKQSLKDSVYWIERTEGRWPRTELWAAPIEVGPVLREELFDKVGTVVLTSATLAVGGRSFDFCQSRLGLNSARALCLGSPFDFQQQAELVLLRDMPDPAEQTAEFEARALDVIRHYVAKTDGHAFVLSTSYAMLRNLAEGLRDWLAANNLVLYSQADGVPRTKLLQQFKANPRGVLLGVESFWQGVDVPGDALQTVIITKLPFSVPDHPLLEARLEAIRRRGGVPFREYQLPEAVLKLKQGFGRLIRTRRDHGRVVILDPRVLTRNYGQVFLDSLPPARRVVESAAAITAQVTPRGAD